MGMQINVYEKPLTRHEYEYLAARSQDFLISENVKVHGPIGETWEPEEAEEASDSTEPTGDNPGEEKARANEGKSFGDYDPDDVTFVQSLDYATLQAKLKEREVSAAGTKEELQLRLLKAVRDSEEVEDIEE